MPELPRLAVLSCHPDGQRWIPRGDTVGGAKRVAASYTRLGFEQLGDTDAELRRDYVEVF